MGLQALQARALQDREWQHGLLNMGVEVTHFQASLASEGGMGCLLLATPKVLLTGRLLHGRDKALSLDIDQVRVRVCLPALPAAGM